MSDNRLKCKHCNLYIKLFRTVLVPLNTLIYIFIYLSDYFVVGIFHGLSCKICARGPTTSKKVQKYYFHQFYCNTFFEVEETKFVQLPIKPKVQYEGAKRFLQLFLELIIILESCVLTHLSTILSVRVFTGSDLITESDRIGPKNGQITLRYNYLML